MKWAHFAHANNAAYNGRHVAVIGVKLDVHFFFQSHLGHAGILAIEIVLRVINQGLFGVDRKSVVILPGKKSCCCFHGKFLVARCDLPRKINVAKVVVDGDAKGFFHHIMPNDVSVQVLHDLVRRRRQVGLDFTRLHSYHHKEVVTNMF